MQSFFNEKELKNLKIDGQDSVISSKKASDIEPEELSTVQPELSLPEAWNISEKETKAFETLNDLCEPLLPGQISLYGVRVTQNEDGDYVFLAFIRQSVEKKMKMKEATISIFDENKEVLGRKTFDLTEFGELPVNTSRPWEFLFSEKDLFTNSIPGSGWKLAFQLNPVSRDHTLEFTKSWKKRLPSEQQRKLKKAVEKMGPPRPGQINFVGLNAAMVESREELHISLLIRNGGAKHINLEKMPLVVEDAAGDIVAKGVFTLDPKLQVKANTSTPWNFVFPKSMIHKSSPDLSKWKAYPPRKQKKKEE
ncbi:accessory Sec system S-layer assembly protein [Alkalicoccus halolimnae]|uniref:Accessory Sec system S-layer assembly protein n=1 Tax=Alkalicoccus halolimnae TaxID=1667239 RepID=A0A5C7F8C2_9BACI|nr:accessory Sec system S-layer assembly protein [Alkalicoccus halolimnae]TXF85618.1 accessory Sec system S-layer assembly protein [Alkalicoccus halolimnae]